MYIRTRIDSKFTQRIVIYEDGSSKMFTKGSKIRLKRINILTIAIFLKKNKSMKINLNLDTFDLEDRENWNKFLHGLMDGENFSLDKTKSQIEFESKKLKSMSLFHVKFLLC